MTTCEIKDAFGELENINDRLANDFPLFESEWTTWDRISHNELQARKAELMRELEASNDEAEAEKAAW